MNSADIIAIMDEPITASKVAGLHAQFAESAKLEKAIKANQKGLGYGG